MERNRKAAYIKNATAVIVSELIANVNANVILLYLLYALLKNDLHKPL